MTTKAKLVPCIDQLEQVIEQTTDRRRAERDWIDTIVRIAEWGGVNQPAPTAFRGVETRDLSITGLSFYDEVAPTTESLIILLGNWYQPTPVIARVVHVQRCNWSDKHACFVGCQFMGQL